MMIAIARMTPGWLNDFQRDGFVCLPDLVSSAMVLELISALEEANGGNSGLRHRGRETYAIRNLLESVAAVRSLAESAALKPVVKEVLGAEAFAVRGLLFDKTPEANWKVAWHQDLTIAVKRKLEVTGFGPWSIKAGIQHVQPPVAVLEKMVTVRLHLDDCTEKNGPLQVLPGSHTQGRLNAENIQAWRARASAISCVAGRGGALLMRPLLLHASSAAVRPGHRRVIHLEFAADTLPGGLEWLG
ncbi:MAG: protein involved in biosynthesis of mitomycin antibiotics/polyketide fumonisin [Pedosphaera sp.]|nr:protein involved in biosynthesis of mitomycin antibiotics/polyketide fumonisin [Pedosphaera sp.]